MARHYDDWIKAFMDYASIGEAPPHIYFWTGVSTIAGALRRKTWIDMGHFKWYPNFYIILVAPPGIIAKSTSASVGMRLLREVDGIHFGPSVVTWQALVKSFCDNSEMFELDGSWYPMSAITIESSELGNLLDPDDRKMMDAYVSFWDCLDKFDKETLGSGLQDVNHIWLNLIAGTTPSWISGSMPEYMIGGGFTSRCLFVYAERKAELRAYPKRAMKRMKRTEEEQAQMRRYLIEDLADMAKSITGEMEMTEEAYLWGEKWYAEHYTSMPKGLDNSRFGGYLARKQTHIHKVAMILSAAHGNSRQITREMLETAATMVTDLEPDMKKVFEKIGQTDDSMKIDRLIDLIKLNGEMTYAEAYRSVHSFFPSHRVFDDMLTGCVKSGYLLVFQPTPGVFKIKLGAQSREA